MSVINALLEEKAQLFNLLFPIFKKGIYCKRKLQGNLPGVVVVVAI